MNKRLRGFSVLIVISIVLVVVVLASAFSYYYLRNFNPAPESYSDFEKELNLQDVENLDVDFQELDSSASNL